jgi:hypothetical protein
MEKLGADYWNLARRMLALVRDIIPIIIHHVDDFLGPNRNRNSFLTRKELTESQKIKVAEADARFKENMKNAFADLISA